MHRYIAFAWDSEDLQQKDTARELVTRLETNLPDMQSALRAHGLAIFCVPGRPRPFRAYSLAHRAGVVLGQLFHRDMDENEIPAAVRLDEKASSEILRTEGRLLLTHYWGAYVALLHNHASGQTFIVRDPSAALPCYVTNWFNVSIAFGAMEDCLSLGVKDFTINWHYVSMALVQPVLQTRDTGLNEVSMVRPGECLEIHAGAERKRSCYWDVVRIATSDPIEKLEDAVSLARRTARTCVGAWASCYERVVMRLSGGLDSSVVLASLVRAPSRPGITCLNYYDESAGGDERTFARMAAQAAGLRSGRPCNLIERKRDASQVPVERLFDPAKSPRPLRYLGLLQLRHTDLQISREYNAPLFNGQGGDAIFFRFTNDAPAIDYVHRHGIDMHLFRIVFEAAMAGDTIWSVLKRSIRAGLFGRNRPYRSPFLRDGTLLKPELIQAALQDESRYLIPEWLRAASPDLAHCMSLEKLQHIETMSIPWVFEDAFERFGEIERIAPLASQPLVELFARIPLYVLTAGGEDRVVPRRAFVTELPLEVLLRQTKGIMNYFTMEIVRHNVDFFRQLLLEGVLVSNQLLDLKKIETFLGRISNDAAPGVADILGFYCDLEIWLRSWLGGMRGARQND